MLDIVDLNPRKGKPRGRIEKDAQDAVIKLKVVKDKIAHLIELHQASRVSSEDFSAAVNHVAEEAGLLASVVRRYVVAKAGEKFAEKKRECEQLSLLFEEVA